MADEDETKFGNAGDIESLSPEARQRVNQLVLRCVQRIGRLENVDEMVITARGILAHILQGITVKHSDGEVCWGCWADMVREVLDGLESELLASVEGEESEDDSDESPAVIH